MNIFNSTLHYRLAFFILLNVFIPSAGTCSAVDLECMTQDFVITAKQLHIPAHPNTCDPSVVRWHDHLILSFDAYVGRDDQPDAIGVVIVDDDFSVIGDPQILELPVNLWQNPRLVTIEDRLYMVYNGTINGGIRRMFIAEVRNEEKIRCGVIRSPFGLSQRDGIGGL